MKMQKEMQKVKHEVRTIDTSISDLSIASYTVVAIENVQVSP